MGLRYILHSLGYSGGLKSCERQLGIGRTGKSTTGFLRPGVKTWLVGEVVLQEIIGVSSKRLLDQVSGFSLLEP